MRQEFDQASVTKSGLPGRGLLPRRIAKTCFDQARSLLSAVGEPTMPRRLSKCVGLRVALLLGVLGVLQVATAYKTASAAELVGYNLRISSDKRLLQAPDNPNVRMMVSRTTRYDEMVGRMMPYFELTNTSDEQDLISWELNIGKTEVKFSSVAGMNSAMTLQDASTPGHLAFHFNGLKPGESYIGRLNLQSTLPEASNALVDFRRALFDVNGDTPDDNATIRAEFTGGYVITGQLPEFTSVDGRLTAKPWAMCNGCTSGCNEVFEYGQTIAVPEPGTIILASLGLLGVTIVGLRRRV